MATRNDRHLTMDELVDRIEAGHIDTVVVAFTDMQGRLQGKRLHGRYFVDHVVGHGTEGCNYLLAVDVDMNTVDGYAISSWEKGYGDMEFVLDDRTRSGCSPTCPRPRWSSATWSGRTTPPCVQSPRVDPAEAARPGGRARLDGAGRHRARVHRCSTRRTRQAHDSGYRDLTPSTSTTSTTRSSAPRGSSRSCATSATTCTPRAWTSRAPRASATSASTRSASCTPRRWRPPTTTRSTRPPQGDRLAARQVGHVHGEVQRARGQLLPHPPVAARHRRRAGVLGQGGRRAHPALRPVRRRRARHGRRLHAAVRAEHQLLQAVRRRRRSRRPPSRGGSTTAPAPSASSDAAPAPGWRTGSPGRT